MSPITPQQVSGRLTVLAEGQVGSPRISGDGRVVVWNEVRDGVSQIMRHEAGDTVQLTKDVRPAVHPDLSGDGSVVVWEQLSTGSLQDPGANMDVYQFRDGSISPVAEGPSNQGSPTISRDGSTIAWDDDGDGRMSRFNIALWRDGATERVTEGKGARMFPFLSGDGRRVFWRDLSGTSQDIWLRDEAGVTKPVIDTDSNQGTPAVTPDGKTLLWTDDAAGDEDVLLFKDGRITTIAGERQVDETWAQMSADASQVVWTDFNFRNGAPAKVHVLLRDGEALGRVDRDDAGLSSFPAISDDGRTIVWMWQDEVDTDNRRIYMLERDAPTTA